MNKFGFFIQTPGAGLDLIERYKPKAVLLMDAESQHIAQVREASPDTTVLYWTRETETGGQQILSGGRDRFGIKSQRIPQI